MVSKLRVLYLASEATPFVKVGGLADVAGELPGELSNLGVDIRLALPFYTSIRDRHLDIEKVATVKVVHAHEEKQAQVFRADYGGVTVLLVDGEPIQRSMKVYADPTSDAHKFIFFSLATLASCETLEWQPHVVHANDWHTAPVVAWIKSRSGRDSFWANVWTLLTIHNLPYMGAGGEAAVMEYGLSPADDPRLPAWARNLPLPIGLAMADKLSTVSPTYADEIQTPEFGCGLEGLLGARRDDLIGILNGIDTSVWDPSDDTALPLSFSRTDLKPRIEIKRQLQSKLDLPETPDVPLLAMVTRLDHQKGIDLAFEALERNLDVPWQFVLLGTGDPELEDRAQLFAATHAHRASAALRFDSQLARQIYGGSDVILIPSRYEPCGLNQMIAMRYGSVPVVRATGGLKDSVQAYAPGGKGTGFVFGPIDAAALAEVLRMTLSVFSDRRRWRGLQLRGMAKDFSWASSARCYRDLYLEMVSSRSI